MTINEMACIIEAEAGVLDFNGKLGVAQCIIDNNFNASAFTTPVANPTEDSTKAAMMAMNGVQRFPGWKVLQLRSFTNYADSYGMFDWTKEKWALDMELIPATDVKGKWGHFYLGRCITPFKRYCGCGKKTMIAKEEMNVRNIGTIGGDIVGKVNMGDAVEVLAETDLGWLKIVWPGIQNGFAYVSNVKNRYFRDEIDKNKITNK